MLIDNIAAGLLVGMVVGATGTGGGALMTPVLVWLFGIAPVTAVGTDLWFAALTKLVGAGMYIRHDKIDWQVLRRLSAGSIPATLATLAVIHLMGGYKISSRTFCLLLGTVLLITACALYLKPWLFSLGRGWRLSEPRHFKSWQPILTGLMGMLLGVLVTLTSVGAGTLGVVMLVYLYPLRMSTDKLVGTDLMHAIPLALIAGAGYLWMGQVNFPLLAGLLCGSIPGVLLGSWLGTRLADAWMRMAVATVLGVIGYKMLMLS
jgi:uncharacterized membrane protein YfcA